MYGLKNLAKLIPLLSVAMISDLFAIMDVKNITERKMNNGKSIASICGMKPK